jgi:hypothetical protein
MRTSRELFWSIYIGWLFGIHRPIIVHVETAAASLKILNFFQLSQDCTSGYEN